MIPIVLLAASVGAQAGPARWALLALTAVGALGHVPIYLLCLPRGRPREDSPRYADGAWPSVTLVVAAHNEIAVIRHKVENSLALEYPGPLQIVVASDGSEDGTDEVVREFEPRGVRLYRNDPRTGKAGMLRRAVGTISSEVVVLSDANAYYDPTALRALVGRFADPSIGGSTGHIRLLRTEEDKDEVAIAAAEQETLLRESASGSCIGVDGAMVAARRELIPAFPDGLILDDFTLAMHVANTGARVVFEPDATGYEFTTPSLSSEYERRARMFAGVVQLFRWGVGVPQRGSGLMRRFLAHKVWRWTAPLFLVSAGLQLLLTVGVLPGLALGTACVAGLWILLSMRHGPREANHRIGFLVVTIMGSLTGLARGLRNRQSGAWRRTTRAAETVADQTGAGGNQE